jgi:hypothetical protein
MTRLLHNREQRNGNTASRQQLRSSDRHRMRKQKSGESAAEQLGAFILRPKGGVLHT